MPHCVYLLRSTTHARTYIGYSPSPAHRLRQHNGELSGGARKTRRGRPWKLQVVLSGFATKRSALQFEAAWQHPDVRLHTRSNLTCPLLRHCAVAALYFSNKRLRCACVSATAGK